MLVFAAGEEEVYVHAVEEGRLFEAPFSQVKEEKGSMRSL